jgi:hypothetical protein
MRGREKQGYEGHDSTLFRVCLRLEVIQKLILCSRLLTFWQVLLIPCTNVVLGIFFCVKYIPYKSGGSFFLFRLFKI